MTMSCSADRISDLPEFILHKIMAFLPLSDFTRTSVLSKLWNSTRKSHPKLVFFQKYQLNHIADDAPEFQQRLADYFCYIDDSMRIFSERRLRIHELFLSLYSIYSDSIPRIDGWLSSALRSGINLLCFRVALGPDIPYPLPENMFSVSKFFYLETLKLELVVMSEKMIRDIARNCPNIRILILYAIEGVKSVEISELYKLESFKIMSTKSRLRAIERISVNASNLKIFACGNCLSCDIDIASSPALQCLDLTYYSIADYKFNLLISRFSLLEMLDLNFCDQLRRVTIISLPRLKSLTINKCRLIESIHIDAPALSSFKYTASFTERFPLLSSKNARGGVDFIYDLDLRVENTIVDSSWFVDLRKFLAGLSRPTNLTICFSNNEVSFDPNVIVGVQNRTLVEVDCLNFKSREIADASSSLEGLMWSCRPKIISFLPYNNDDGDDVIVRSHAKVLCQKLLGTKQQVISCCHNIHFKCWRHDLKAVNINYVTSLNEKQSGIDYNLLRFAWYNLSRLPKKYNPRFLLEWNFDKK